MTVRFASIWFLIASGGVSFAQTAPAPPTSSGPSAAINAPAPAPKVAESKPFKVSFGGFVKIDAIYNSTGNPDPAGGEFPGGADLTDYLLVPSAVPTGDADDGGGYNLNARESRFWLKTEADSDYGAFKSYVEVDFYGFNAGLGDERLTNSSSMRIRHAYGQLGGLMGGQTWSTFMDLKALPEKIDFGSPAGRVFLRQAMLRYTRAFGASTVDVAVENPETTLTAPDGSRVVRDDDRVPDVVVRYSYDVDGVHVTVAGLGRELRADGAVGPDMSDSAIGWAVRGSGKFSLFGEDNVRFAATYGQGIGRYISLNGFHAASIDDRGQLELIPVVGGLLSYQRWWTETVRSNLALSHAQAFNDTDRMPETVNKSLTSVHANTMWNPMPKTRIGVELIYARRERESGEDGALIRVQGSVRYSF